MKAEVLFFQSLSPMNHAQGNHVDAAMGVMVAVMNWMMAAMDVMMAVLVSGAAMLAVVSSVISLGCSYYTMRTIHHQVTIIRIWL